jgi:hypothetical protein
LRMSSLPRDVARLQLSETREHEGRSRPRGRAVNRDGRLDLPERGSPTAPPCCCVLGAGCGADGAGAGVAVGAAPELFPRPGRVSGVRGAAGCRSRAASRRSSGTAPSGTGTGSPRRGVPERPVLPSGCSPVVR